MLGRLIRRLAVATLVATAFGACSSDSPPPRSAAPATTGAAGPAPPRSVPDTDALDGYPAYAAVLRRESIVRAEPGDTGASVATFDVRNENGAPQTFLIDDEVVVDDAIWYRVLLPIRPNGTTGWVQRRDVRVVGLRYHLEVHLQAFRADLFDGEHLVRSIEIGVGTDQTPTPGGTYFIKELLRPPDQETIYGHYVFGLSGFSNVLLDWPGGGVLGIHGTNDPDGTIGRKVSHGCVRMRNADIEYLAGILPLGTPVAVSA
jgi:lipoprotein-anchoring transpeptidase ErfK/SrfK